MSAAAAPKLKLFYFNGRGRGETTRLLLAEGNIPYEDVRTEHKDWPAIKDSMPFGQMPVLEVDGIRIAESAAIERYVARIANLYGSTPLEQARIDMIVEGLRDLSVEFIKAVYTKDDTEKKANMAKLFKDEVPKWAQLLTKQLTNNKDNNYFVGKNATLADIAFYSLFSNLLALDADCLKNFGLLASLYKLVEARSGIAKWIKERPVSAF